MKPHMRKQGALLGFLFEVPLFLAVSDQIQLSGNTCLLQLYHDFTADACAFGRLEPPDKQQSDWSVQLLPCTGFNTVLQLGFCQTEVSKTNQMRPLIRPVAVLR